MVPLAMYNVSLMFEHLDRQPNDYLFALCLFLASHETPHGLHNDTPSTMFEIRTLFQILSTAYEIHHYNPTIVL